jgi:hypothetical protein
MIREMRRTRWRRQDTVVMEVLNEVWRRVADAVEFGIISVAHDVMLTYMTLRAWLVLSLPSTTYCYEHNYHHRHRFSFSRGPPLHLRGCLGCQHSSGDRRPTDFHHLTPSSLCSAPFVTDILHALHQLTSLASALSGAYDYLHLVCVVISDHGAHMLTFHLLSIRHL